MGKTTLLVREKAGCGICFFPMEFVFWPTSAFTLVRIDMRSTPLKHKIENTHVTMKKG